MHKGEAFDWESGRFLRRMAKPRTAMVQGKPITAFTLIELLVVIAMIALLMAILMSSLAAEYAKEPLLPPRTAGLISRVR